MRLLWVDDDQQLVTRSLPLFLQHGFEVLPAATISRALTILRRESTTLSGVLLDVRLAGENGLEFLSEIKDKYPHLIVVIFTAYPDYGDHLDALESGAALYLQKVQKAIPANDRKQRAFFESLHRAFRGVRSPRSAKDQEGEPRADRQLPGRGAEPDGQDAGEPTKSWRPTGSKGLLSVDPIALLQMAVRAVPAVRYALGVGGLAAIVAIVLVGWKLEATAAVFGTLIVFAFMVVLVIFAALARLGGGHLKLLALFLAWAFTALTVFSSVLFVSCAFYDYPKTLPCLLGGNECRPAARAADSLSTARAVKEDKRLFPTFPAPESSLKAGPSAQLLVPAKVTSLRYRPFDPTGQRNRIASIVVSRTVVADELRLKIDFKVPPNEVKHFHYNELSVYGFQITPSGRSETGKFLVLPGDWQPGDQVSFSVDVPNQVADAQQGCWIVFCIGSQGGACIPSPNLLTGVPIQQ